MNSRIKSGTTFKERSCEAEKGGHIEFSLFGLDPVIRARSLFLSFRG